MTRDGGGVRANVTLSESRRRIAVDIGGTFTDVVVQDPTTGSLRFEKVPTTPRDPAAGVLEGFAKAECGVDEIEYFAHGATLALNALLTRTGARTAIVTTQGFRDVYLLGRTDRRVSYDFRYRKPQSLVSRDLIFEVRERLDFRGGVLQPFDYDGASRVAKAIRDLGVEAVALCFLHAYANDAHEKAMIEVLSEHAPDAVVSASHQLSREYREYERMSTTVLDAYTRPLVERYIGRLGSRLRDSGFSGQFFLIRSGGGAMTADAAKQAPVNLILSGPAGGVMGAAEFARATGHLNLIAVDMGGTSLDASLIVEGEPLQRHETEFQGLPITVPSLNINTIGAGGGSELWIDAGGHLQVGPGSAGAEPGPASYGRGGTVPTLTDAAVVCGYLGAEVPLAGTLALDEGLARSALLRVSEPLGMSPEQVARGALRIAATKMVGAIRAITVELGYRPADFGLLAFGGAGGLLACEVARDLQIGTVIVPPGPGSFSAFGMLMADVRYDFAQTTVSRLELVDMARLEDQFREMEAQASSAAEHDGFGGSDCVFEWAADVRYEGQEHSVTVPLPRYGGAAIISELPRSFAAAHEQRYGHALDDPVEVVTLRLSALVPVTRPELAVALGNAPATSAGPSQRAVFVDQGSWSSYIVMLRPDIAIGAEVCGPAVISEHTGTVVLHEGDAGVVGPHGELVIRVGE